ncbi:MAG: flagellar assembly protein FliW [Desulfobaccales bacterium]
MATHPQKSTEPTVSSIKTKNFGPLEVRSDQIIYLEPGLLGFTRYHRYVLIEHHQEAPFLWLQCLDKADLAFVVVDPRIVLPDYQPGPLAHIMESLEVEHPEDLKILVILTIPPGKPQDMTANLMGPVVINLKTRQGRQLIVEAPQYSHKHRLLPG